MSSLEPRPNSVPIHPTHPAFIPLIPVQAVALAVAFVKNPSNSTVKQNTFGWPNNPHNINHLHQKKNGAITTPNPVSSKQL